MTGKTIVLTGGGTGGHVIPLLALLTELERYFDRIVYVGCGEPERGLATAEGLEFFEVPSPKFQRKLCWSNLAIPHELSRAVSAAKQLLNELQPAVILGKGGFASLPTVLAARKLKIPVIAHESDLSLGLANKIAERKGALLVTSFDTGGKTVGLPLRESVYKGNADAVYGQIPGYDPAKKTLLVVGGSSGAAALNAIVKESGKLTETYNVVHLTGKSFEAKPRAGYLPLQYTNAMGDCYAAADVVVSRAGATAVAELSALCKRTVLVPLPKGRSRGDQEENAEYARAFGATVLRQNELTTENLLTAIKNARPMRACVKDGRVALAELCDKVSRENPREWNS